MAILIKDEKTGANVSVASVNGYTKDNVIKAKRFLKEIGSNRRTFPIERLVEMYNEVKGTKEKAQGCKPCQATKYYNGLQNYAYFGELTLVNTNRCTKDDLDLAKIDAKKEELNSKYPLSALTDPEVIELAKQSGFTAGEEYLDEVHAIEEEQKEKEDIKERMAKVRAAKKAKKEVEEKND